MTAIWITRFGWCLITFGAVLWTPLADLLPVELWLWLARLGRGSMLPGQEVHFRVVPASSALPDPVRLLGVVLIIVGAAALFAGRKMAARRQSP